MWYASKLDQATTLVTCIREVTGPNLDRNTEYLEILHGLPQFIQMGYTTK
jgi:hypothetical protein